MQGGMELRGINVLVVGLARTGAATALFCAARAGNVTATESRTESEIGESVAVLREAGENVFGARPDYSESGSCRG
jgi:UDP-N-acetylmuramoylalanine-D-glutamate ligase